jgi:hypothetical protein
MTISMSQRTVAKDVIQYPPSGISSFSLVTHIMYTPGRSGPGERKQEKERDIESVKQFTEPELKALHLALDIEQDLIEARFTEIVQTEDRGFRYLADEIVRDTAIHCRLVEKKITQVQAKG